MNKRIIHKSGILLLSAPPNAHNESGALTDQVRNNVVLEKL